ncbi:MAG: hypothetical protein Q9N68_01315 [Gammaproteobacteria bacterium]|nr:hypothetical protein [Gammaproteobacteria bacterium]
MCKLCWGVVFVFALVSGGLVYKFILSGSVLEASDGRAAIQLSQGEKDLVLSEMRAFLSSVQHIVAAVSNDNLADVAQAAREVGREAQQAVPGSLMGKLPLGFKKLGHDTHSKFDQLALDAEQLGDASHTLKQLAELTQNCVACHAAYRLDLEQK